MHTLVYGLESWAIKRDTNDRRDLLFLKKALAQDEEAFKERVRQRQRLQQRNEVLEDDAILMYNV